MSKPGLRADDRAPGLLIGDGVRIDPSAELGAHVVIHAGARIGPGVRIGDHAQVRERADVAAGSTVGSFASIDPEVIIGRRVSIQTRCYLSRGSTVEDDVFVGPGVTIANDDTMGRHLSGQALRGATLRRACRVGAGVTICPGVEIGEEAFVAAGAVVAADVAARTVVMGVPARTVRQVPDEDLLERWR